MAASSSTPGPSASVPAPSTSTSTSSTSSVPAHARGDSLSVPASAPDGHNTGTWSSAASAAAAGARDPRGKARSREYLKQCLQEITYLTSSATLNPLAAHSYAAPSVPRPRKVLPEQVPPASAPGVINLAQPPAAAGSAQTGEVPPLAGAESLSSAPSSSSGPTPSKSAPAVMSPAPAAESASSSNKPAPHHDLLTSFPSDPPSAFVPLRRQISQPGQQGPGALSRSTNPHQLQGQSRKQRDDAALDPEIARLAAPEANEDKPDDVSAALAAEKGALISQREPAQLVAPVVVAEPEPLVKEDEIVNAAPGAASEKAAAPSSSSPSSSNNVEPSTDIGLDAEHDGELKAKPEPVKFSPEELALQAAHAAPEANEEKPDDAVALIATAGEDGEDESEVEGKDVAPQDDKDEVRLSPPSSPTRPPSLSRPY